ncbi:MAG: cytidine deaminase [Planctomycetaceae bacterium]|nr:cytidine deaminase [Planctomycetaceae bacterium]
MKRDLRDELIRQAIEIRQRAYAPYSKFLVGAAVRTASGKTFLGCNVENASYGLAVCAERSAVFAAITAGEKQFECMAIATQGGSMPCGACRQVLSEFNPDLPIYIVDVENPDKIVEGNLWDLLPGAFKLDEKGKSKKSKVQGPKSKVKE